MVGQQPVRVGIDIGGTFTDFVIFYHSNGRLETFKLLSTPENPALSVLTGLEKIRSSLQGSGLPILLSIIHGSTVATNALLERKGAVTALINTCGFRDILAIGRQNRPSLYDFFANPPVPLVPDELRFEVEERIDRYGNVLIPLDDKQVQDLCALLTEKQVESVAICLLFSFVTPSHEQRIGEALRRSGFPVSLSSEILPEYREYERASTTVVNAYVSPILERYLRTLESSIGPASRESIRVMGSNGGHISLAEAWRNGVRCVLSGPAGGVIGALSVGRLALNKTDVRLLTYDMGGTSTDVSLIDEAPRFTTESVIGGCPIRIPILDIHTIGAGGGSIARVDLGGALQVGPESAGADPGPACYGRGDPKSAFPTVTDANLVLSRMDPESFLDGQIPLQPERAWAALENLSAELGLNPVEAAAGVVEVANVHMEGALRLISVERGYDPHDFTLLSFGGAGGLHAADLARRLEIPRLIVSPYASTLSAFGMLSADIIKDYTQTVMLSGDTAEEGLEKAFRPLVERGRQEMIQEGLEPGQILIQKMLDMRYTGQSYELLIPFENGSVTLRDRFCQQHEHIYGYAHSSAPIEIVNLRVRTICPVPQPSLARLPLAGPDPSRACLGERSVVLSAYPKIERRPIPWYRYELLLPGNRIAGPAIILRSDTTVFLGEHDQAVVDDYLNLIISLNLS